MKLLQEIRGLAQITSRRPEPRLPGLFLLQMRNQVTQATGLRRKIVIPVEMPEISEVAQQITILYRKPASLLAQPREEEPAPQPALGH